MLDLIIYPNPILREIAKPVESFDEELSTLVNDMAETMYAGNGVGLAAPQIGRSIRLFIIDVSPQEGAKKLEVFINPKILATDCPTVWNEGCLSLPGLFRDVPTYKSVEVQAYDLEGKPFSTKATDLRAVAILHEYGHLEGEIFLDRLNPVKRRMTRKYWQKNRNILARDVYDELKVGYILNEAELAR